MASSLKPVILTVPFDPKLPIPERVLRQRRMSRLALARAAELGGAQSGDWPQRPDGAPLPRDGWHWSVSHKRHFVAAVVARQPVGIDIERITPRGDGLHELAGTPDEWALLGGHGWPEFFRLWTAKEAVLKAGGWGLARFASCRLIEVPNSWQLVLTDGDRPVRVQHLSVEDHLTTVTCDDQTIEWQALSMGSWVHPNPIGA